MTDIAIEPTDGTEPQATRVVPAGPGPLAPYRFALSLGFAAIVAGEPLLHAAEGGEGLERALLKAFGAGVVMWFPTGLINRLLVKAEAADPAEPAASGPTQPS